MPAKEGKLSVSSTFCLHHKAYATNDMFDPTGSGFIIDELAALIDCRNVSKNSVS